MKKIKKNRKEKLNILRKRAGLSIVSIFILSIAAGIKAYAEGTADEYINIYIKNDEILKNNSLTDSAIRTILWYITKAIVFIADGCEKLYDTAFGFIDITLNEKVNAFMESFKPVIVGIMALSLLYLGIVFILSHDKKPNLAVNICIFALVVTMGTTLLTELNSGVLAFKSGVDSLDGEKNTSQVYKVIDNNLIDLVDIGSQDGKKFKSLSKLDFRNEGKSKTSYFNPGINRKNFSHIDYAEVLNFDGTQFSWDADSKKILQNKINVVIPGKVYTTREVYNGFGWNSGDDADMGNEFYYRYHFRFIIAWLEIAALALIYITMSYKCVRVEFELVVARLLAFLYSAELSGGEKIKKILVFIRDSYILLCITTVCIKVFGLVTSITHEEIDNGFVEAIIVLFLAFAVIDGPNLVERLLGLDAGLKSSTARLLTAYGAVKGVARTVTDGVRSGVTGVVGRKSKPPVPQDGKRHGGLIDRFSGISRDGKNIGNKEWEDRKNREGEGSRSSGSSSSKNSKDDINHKDESGSSFMDSQRKETEGRNSDFVNNTNSNTRSNKDGYSAKTHDNTKHSPGNFMNSKKKVNNSIVPKRRAKSQSRYMDKKK